MTTKSTTHTTATSGRDAVIVDTVRTPRGRGRPLGASKPGAYAAFHPQELAAHVLLAIVGRNALPPDDLDDVILGCVTQVDDQSANIARHAVLAAGLPVSVPGTTVTRACGSGLQALSYAIMGVMTGAQNVVIAGGLDWAYDFSGILDGRQLSDPKGNGVIYANHCYDNKGDSVYIWIAKMELATAKLPVIVSEFGGTSGPSKREADDNWLLHVLQAIEDHQWSYTAWDLHPRAGPRLISDWNYTPSARFGVFVKQSLAGTLPAYTPPPQTNSPAQ